MAKVPPGGVLRLNRHKPRYDRFTWRPQTEHDLRVRPLIQEGLISKGEIRGGEAHDHLVELSHLLCGSLFQEANLRAKAVNFKSPTKKMVTDRLRQLLKTSDLTKPAGPRWAPFLHTKL
jgi:hypothetical protein